MHRVNAGLARRLARSLAHPTELDLIYVEAKSNYGVASSGDLDPRRFASGA
jgi:hypothetical protein